MGRRDPKPAFAKCFTNKKGKEEFYAVTFGAIINERAIVVDERGNIVCMGVFRDKEEASEEEGSIGNFKFTVITDLGETMQFEFVYDDSIKVRHMEGNRISWGPAPNFIPYVNYGYICEKDSLNYHHVHEDAVVLVNGGNWETDKDREDLEVGDEVAFDSHDMTQKTKFEEGEYLLYRARIKEVKPTIENESSDEDELVLEDVRYSELGSPIDEPWKSSPGFSVMRNVVKGAPHISANLICVHCKRPVD